MKAHLFKAVVLIGFLASTQCVVAELPLESSVDVGVSKQLLVDDHVIAETRNLTRAVGKVIKANGAKPLSFTRTTEDGKDAAFESWPLFVSVYFDPTAKRFRMWHRVSFDDRTRGLGAKATVAELGLGSNYERGYSESADGVNFKFVSTLKGLTTSGDTNLVVTIDEHEQDPEHRYKIGYDSRTSVNAAALAHSADGIRWVPYNNGQPVTYRANDFTNQIIWQPSVQAYRLLTRTDFGAGGGPLANTVDVVAGKEKLEVRGVRSMLNRDVKADPTKWELEHHFLLDGEEQISLDGPPIAERLKDPKFLERVRQQAERRQIYCMTDWVHEGVHFGLMAVLEYPSDVSEGRTSDHVTRHERSIENYYFATCRDGLSWNFHWVYAGQPLVPRGPAGAWDKDMIFPASQIVTHENKHWIFYGANNERHGAAEKDVWFARQGSVGLAHLRLDGFVGLDAGRDGGTLVTKPFKLEGKRLLLNVNAAQAGEVRVEVLDAAGNPIPKFSSENAVAHKGIDDTRFQPTWKGQSDLSAIDGQVVRLKIHLTNSSLYAFHIQP